MENRRIILLILKVRCDIIFPEIICSYFPKENLELLSRYPLEEILFIFIIIGEIKLQGMFIE